MGLGFMKKIVCINSNLTRPPMFFIFNNLEGWDEGTVRGRLKREKIYVYLWLIHVNVWQKPIQYYKAIIL